MYIIGISHNINFHPPPSTPSCHLSWVENISQLWVPVLVQVVLEVVHCGGLLHPVRQAVPAHCNSLAELASSLLQSAWLRDVNIEVPSNLSG